MSGAPGRGHFTDMASLGALLVASSRERLIIPASFQNEYRAGVSGAEDLTGRGSLLIPVGEGRPPVGHGPAPVTDSSQEAVAPVAFQLRARCSAGHGEVMSPEMSPQPGEAGISCVGGRKPLHHLLPVFCLLI